MNDSDLSIQFINEHGRSLVDFLSDNVLCPLNDRFGQINLYLQEAAL